MNIRDYINMKQAGILDGGLSAGGPGSGPHSGAGGGAVTKAPVDTTKHKLFKHLDDSPDSHHQRMVHGLTEYDIKQSSKRGYNHYALGQYLQHANEAHNELKQGQPIEKVLPNHFQDRLLTHMQKRLGVPQT